MDYFASRLEEVVGERLDAFDTALEGIADRLGEIENKLDADHDEGTSNAFLKGYLQASLAGIMFQLKRIGKVETEVSLLRSSIDVLTKVSCDVLGGIKRLDDLSKKYETYGTDLAGRFAPAVPAGPGDAKAGSAAEQPEGASSAPLRPRHTSTSDEDSKSSD
jgi:hypothetical protein